MLLLIHSPVPATAIARPFGWSAGLFHAGVDYLVNVNTPVRAAAAGIVIRAGSAGRRGLRVVIQHAGKVLTTYEHNTSLQVRRGDRVASGQVIARSGFSGLAGFPHLHFGVVVAGRLVNPVDAMDLGIDTSTGLVNSYKFQSAVLTAAVSAAGALAFLLWPKNRRRAR